MFQNDEVTKSAVYVSDGETTSTEYLIFVSLPLEYGRWVYVFCIVIIDLNRAIVRVATFPPGSRSERRRVLAVSYCHRQAPYLFLSIIACTISLFLQTINVYRSLSLRLAAASPN